MNQLRYRPNFNRSHRLKLSLWLAFCLVALTACSDNKLSPIGNNDVILAFGDSLTLGVGVTASDSYPAVLAALSGRTVINAGVSGETTTEGLRRFEKTLTTHQPALVILLEGGNDILQNQDLEKTKSNLNSMIELCMDYGAEVLLIGVPRKNLFSDTSPIYTELADSHQLILISDLVADLLRTPKYKSDAVHFNAVGYRKMAETIMETLQDNGAL